MKRWMISMSLFSMGGCATQAANTDRAGAPERSSSDEAPPAVPTDSERWQSTVDAEATSLRAAYPQADVRIIVLDERGTTTLARQGDVVSPTPTGSTIKPVGVFAALRVGLDPMTTVDVSTPLTIGDLTIEDHRNAGTLSLSEAIAKSSNIAVARVLEHVSWEDAYAEAARWVSLPDPSGVTRVQAVEQLGGFETEVSLRELVEAYAAIAREPEGPIVLDMLRLAVTSHGTGNAATVPGLEVLGKTGTARRGAEQDALFVGRVANDSETVWIGISVGGVPHEAYGSVVAAPAFANIAKDALR